MWPTRRGQGFGASWQDCLCIWPSSLVWPHSYRECVELTLGSAFLHSKLCRHHIGKSTVSTNICASRPHLSRESKADCARTGIVRIRERRLGDTYADIPERGSSDLELDDCYSWCFSRREGWTSTTLAGDIWGYAGRQHPIWCLQRVSSRPERVQGFNGTLSDSACMRSEATLPLEELSLLLSFCTKAHTTSDAILCLICESSATIVSELRG